MVVNRYLVSITEGVLIMLKARIKVYVGSELRFEGVVGRGVRR